MESVPEDVTWRKLHAQNPYEGFNFRKWQYDPQGWGSESPVFEELIAKIKPTVTIEVGTWKGASAIHMAKCLEGLGVAGNIFCVDTWLGALEFWTDQSDASRYGALDCKNGFPQVYFQFLANVMYNGVEKRIIPFPATSTMAADYFKKTGIQAELIYIDASHEAPDVYADISNYWPLVKVGGVLLGDDYDWPGVKEGADRFSKEHRLQLTVKNEKWFLNKFKP